MVTALQQAEQHRAAAESQYQAVRDNTDLRPEVARQRIAQVYVAAKDAIGALAEQHAASAGAEKAAAERDLHGVDDLTAKMSPAERAAVAMNLRDAQQRAAQATTEPEARAVLASADQVGDELQARAIGSHAINSGFTTVADTYLSARPAKAAALERLRAASVAPSVNDLFGFAAPVPSEFVGAREQAIRTLAGQ